MQPDLTALDSIVHDKNIVGIKMGIPAIGLTSVNTWNFFEPFSRQHCGLRQNIDFWARSIPGKSLSTFNVDCS
jgi:hypothetical protein